MNIEIDGALIKSERDFHATLAIALKLSNYYGANLDALWDTLSTDIERPICLVWKNSSSSQAALGDKFDLIVDILKRVEKQDIDWGLSERFELRLI